MPQLVPIEQAAMNALALWIGTHPQFAEPLAAGLQVESRWPDPDKGLPTGGAITVVQVGKRRETPFSTNENVVVGQTNLTPTTAAYQFMVKFCQQDLQLDVWATSSPVRDDLVARLDIVLNAGLQGMGFTAEAPCDSGVTLPLAAGDGWGNSAADFAMGEPERLDGDTAESEYRTTYHGDVWVNLTITATTNRLAHAILQERVRSALIATTQAAIPPVPYGTCTVNNDGSVTYAL